MTRYLIDITRFISRIGRGKPTGIDRVEIEYIKEVLRRDPEVLAIGKLGSEFILLQADVLEAAFEKVALEQPFGRAAFRDSVRFKIPKAERQSRTYFRRYATRVCATISDVVAGLDLSEVEYINVGHSNLTETGLKALRSANCARISIMIHDMIPLDFPQFTRAGIPARFEARMKSVATYADRVICNSKHTESRVLDYFGAWGATPGTIVAHLGVNTAKAPSPKPSPEPYFVVLGTIEPRKNHTLLFTVWEKIAQEPSVASIPKLHVIGRRGWNNEEVFRFLDTSPLIGRHIFEHSDIDDDVLFAHLQNCSGLLFPSFAEGYGLPALEAAQMGTPVLCSKLDVFKELMGDYAVYLDENNPDEWANAILNVAQTPDKAVEKAGSVASLPTIPRWESHFCHVFGDNRDRMGCDE